MSRTLSDRELDVLLAAAANPADFTAVEVGELRAKVLNAAATPQTSHARQSAGQVSTAHLDVGTRRGRPGHGWMVAAAVVALVVIVVGGAVLVTSGRDRRTTPAASVTVSPPFGSTTNDRGDLDYGSRVFVVPTPQPRSDATVTEADAIAAFDAQEFNPVLVPGSPQVELRLVYGEGIRGRDPAEAPLAAPRLAWVLVWHGSALDLLGGEVAPGSPADRSSAESFQCTFVAVVAADMDDGVLNTHQTCSRR